MKRLAVIVAVLAALGGASGQASAPSRIVFMADRAPSVSGEIYRVDPDGTLVDLSSSPFQDSGPVASVDGQRIAFFSDRSGAVSVWEAGIDGSGLVQVGPSLAPASTWQRDYDFGEYASSLAWQPGGNLLAAVYGHTLFMLQPGQEPLTAFTVAENDRLTLGPWSPDGSILVVYDYLAGVAHAFAPDGSQLWSVPRVESNYWAGWTGDLWLAGSWSRGGLLALPIGAHPNESRALRVYDESGRLRFVVHGRVSGRPGWSPDGKRLAVVIGNHAEVFTAAGRRVLRIRHRWSGNHYFCRQVVWASDSRFIVGGVVSGTDHICRAFSIAVRTGKASSTSGPWFGRPLSADRKLAAVASQSGNQTTIGATSTTGHTATTYEQVTACASKLWPSPVSSLQFVGPGHSLVYTTYCPYPPTILYSVAPDGSGLQELGSSSAQCGTCANLGFQGTALSPDATQIAYGSGYGGIHILNSDGTGVQLTVPPTACTAPGGEKVPYSDTSPSWSPDGRAIVFSRTGCGGGSELCTVAIASGGVRALGLAGDQAAWGLSKIAYIGQTDGVWTANPDGTDPTQVATNGRDPAWSPEGRLAYLTGSNTAVVDSTPIQLPFTDLTSLAWSPDNIRFVVTARTTSAAPFDVYTINTDGTNPVQLTQNYDALDLAGWR